MIKFFWISWNNSVLYVVDHSKAHKVVVPHYVVRDHEEAQKSFRKQKLSLFIISVCE